MKWKVYGKVAILHRDTQYAVERYETEMKNCSPLIGSHTRRALAFPVTSSDPNTDFKVCFFKRQVIS